MSFSNASLVFLGAGLGGVARWLALLLLPTVPTLGFSFPLLLVNAFGGFMAGIVVGVMSAADLKYSALGVFVMTGFLGGFTTFSAFTAEGYALWIGQPFVAIVHSLCHVVVCLLMFGSALKLLNFALN